jgi:PiT family inorganic phosphate transporter
MVPTAWLLALAGFYLGWNLGANNAGNCIGTSIGAGFVSFRRGSFLVALFVVLGAVLQGGKVMGTIGGRIVSGEMPPGTVLGVLVSGGLVINLATLRRIPASASQAIVGGLVGAGLAVGRDVHWPIVGRIFLAWILCPLLSLGLGVAIYLLVRVLFRRIIRSPEADRVLGWFLLASACYAAYSLGANNVGNVVGPIAIVSELPQPMLIALGGLSMAVGVVTYGRGVADAIGRGIVPFDISGAFAAQTAMALSVHLFTMLGLPVSTVHAIVGAVVGIGLLRGIRAVGRRKIVEISVGWVLIPTVTGLLGFLFCRLFVR